MIFGGGIVENTYALLVAVFTMVVVKLNLLILCQLRAAPVGRVVAVAPLLRFGRRTMTLVVLPCRWYSLPGFK
jgi:hypothetical protein